MDTVSAIRGNMGRPALPPAQRTMMMDKEMKLSDNGTLGPNDPVKFEFMLESTTDNKLIDAYIGVDFSIIYKVSVSIMLETKVLKKGSAEFYCKVTGSGIKPELGRSYVPQKFSITPDKIAAQPGQSAPKFEFFGEIASTNCQFNECFDGNLICKDSELQIKSIEI